MRILRRRELIVAVALYFGVFAGLSAALLSKHRPGDGSDYWVHLAAITSLAEGSTPAHLPLGGNPGAARAPLRPLPRRMGPRTALHPADRHGRHGAGRHRQHRRLPLRARIPGLTLRTNGADGLLLPDRHALHVGRRVRLEQRYYLSILPGVGPFPSTLAWGLSFFVLGLIETWSRCGGVLRLAGAMLLGVLTVAVHPLTALMFGLTFPVLWVWLSRTTWRRRWSVLSTRRGGRALAAVGARHRAHAAHAVLGHGILRSG